MRRVLLAVFSTVAGLVMLLSFKTEAIGTNALPAAVGTSGPVDPTTPATTAPSPTATAGSGGTTGVAATPSTPASSAAAAAATGTYTGIAADTRYGPVQVQITVTNGKVTGVRAVDYPQDNPRDAEINAQAIPQLNAEAARAGSADIDTVSGATYTSNGYLQSLQNALDQAGL